MVRALFALPVVILLVACGGESGIATAIAEEATETEEAAMPAELCAITKGEHIDAPTGGNKSTSSSNGVTISVMGSRSQSLSSRDGKAEVTVTGAATLHLTFPGDEKVTVQVNADADLVRITIGGADAITCQAVV
ncbi:MAG: hypothetical protein AAFY34_06345 [Pseudomonadota bacterium]